MKAPPLRPAAVTAFPAPPIDVLPYTVMEWEWFEAELAFGQVEGWMRDTTVEGDRRKYRFEVQRGHNGEPRAIVSACDPENSNPFDDRDRGQDRSFLVPWRGLKGLPAGAQEKRLRERALRIAAYLRDVEREQQQFLFRQFETAVPVEIEQPKSGRTYATHSGWLIIRALGYAVPIQARRLAADGSAGKGLIVRGCAP
jgi:hypothetical protein